MSDAVFLPTSDGRDHRTPWFRPLGRTSTGHRDGAGLAMAIERAVQQAVIPQLAGEHLSPQPGPAPSDGEAERLALALLGPDAAGAAARFAARLGQAGDDAPRLATMTEAARHLGRLWEDDRASFPAVTLATTHLQSMLRGLSGAPAGTAYRGTAMLLPVTGEQHTLGLSMLVHGFRRAGWRVLTPAAAEPGGLPALLARAEPDLVGFSAAADMHLARLERCVDVVRRTSPERVILVGGPVFLRLPELARAMGACATAADGASAVRLANALVKRRRRLLLQSGGACVGGSL